jgi:hypothetical protein
MIQVLRSLKPHATFRGNGQKVEWFGWWWKIKTMRFDVGRLQINTIWLRQSNFPT